MTVSPPHLLSLALLLGLGCSPATRAFRLPGPTPQVVRFKIICEKSMKHCDSRAKLACNGAFNTISSSASRTKPKRISSEPSPRSVGPRYQHERWFGTLLVDCQGPDEEPSTGPVAAATQEPRLAMSSQRLCIPGATQACLGPGACRGAQACNTEGLGYLPCDCGTLEPAAVSPEVFPPEPTQIP